ncbi:MAG: Rieske 2Fe-2S domain-containing protein [Actinomycetota bacterium]|nr:Rieske 2Fe-2S domain-containing protein [Actinomycetota bacterium]MDA2971371.1 Rieske 2Fe-2S domain-containing protein [Actinomycetota bacterium]MDA3000953.1 Rieske 2Fe-2S domain-containing protein [Actinomycetota bacterium]
MSSAATIAIVIAAIVVLAAVVLVTTARRADVRGAGALSRETVKRDKSSAKVGAPAGASFESAEVSARSTALEKASEVAPVAWVAPDEEAVGVSRRQFFNRAAVTMMSASIGAFGVAVVAFLWPRAGGGFGSKVNVGRLDDLIVQIRNEKGFVYKPEARTWLTAFPAGALPKARAAYASQPSVLSGMEAGVVALYQKCPHLGCRVPECKSSQWFECPCHGSQYDRVGEKKAGPAPRGMDRFGVSVSNGSVIVDTGTVFNGPAIGVNTTGQEAEGPHCITGGGDH